MHKIVIASDSFKGSLTSLEVAEAAAEGVSSVLPGCLTICMDIADGGEGTYAALTAALEGKTVNFEVSDPLGRKVIAEYGMIEDTGTAIIEMAQASGLPLLNKEERNPLLTSTYGTGEMIADALKRGCRKFIIGIGGSATNDGGTGMLEALGYRFIDKGGKVIKGCRGGLLREIASIDTSGALPELEESEFTIACDVNTPFCGPEGATHIFSGQKGADKDMEEILEDGMTSFCQLTEKTTGINMAEIPGSGAAGGLGGAFAAYLGAKLESGIKVVLDTLGFDSIIKDADLIITGEGRLDSQTGKGKVITGITDAAGRNGIPVIAVTGRTDISEEEARRIGLTATFQIGPAPQNESDLEYAMRPEVASKRISGTVAKALVSLFPSLCHGNL